MKPSSVAVVLPNVGVNATDSDVDGTVVVVVGVDTHGSKIEGAKAKPPRNTNGAITTDNRPAEVRPQRDTITPASNKNKPANTINVELPVAGKLHTSPANITNCPQTRLRHNSGQSD